ncbi:MAG: hypothetical protein DRI57_18200 [Deltaproteobacteria bacterium]|nr:MAG: hypothetical protein DRI57_18200 [Deltaproteobacteria bacterium]
MLKFNKLYFTPEIENEYQKYHNNQSLFSRRGGLILALIVFDFFLLSDYTLMPEKISDAIIVRLFIVTPILSFGLVFTYIKKYSQYIEYVFIFVICAALGGNLFLMCAYLPESSEYYVGLILILIYGVIFFRISFKNTLLLSVSLFVSYEILIASHYNLSSDSGDLLRKSMFILASGFLSPFAAFFFEKMSRKIFMQRNKIERATESAENANKAKSEFLANMSHEIRTPITAILGFTDLLSDGDLNDRHRHYLNAIKNNSSLLLSLINDILDYSKIEAGKIGIEKIPFSLENLFDNIKINSGILLKKKQSEVEMRVRLPPDYSKYIIGDPTRILQIMNNLISNAVKFTDKGFIECGFSVRNEYLEFYVRDTGIGISEENQSFVFNSFEQADTSTTRKYGGTGLGLAISKNLVNLMGGEIRIHSVIGDGAAFYFTIPYRPVKEEQILKSDKAVRVKKKGALNHKILLVEDNEFNQILVGTILEGFGFSVEIAGDGQDAISKYKSDSSIGIILMDIQMPIMDGLEATMKIREIEQDGGKKRIPIIALTAGVSESEKDEIIKAGLDDYVSKPIDRKHLLDILRRYSG